MLKKGYNKSKILIARGKNRSSITRQVKKNSDKRNGVYTDELASKEYAISQKEKPKYTRFTSMMKVAIEHLLKEDYSPEQVVGFLKKQQEEIVSTEFIYQHIWEDKRNNGNLHFQLRRQERGYRKRVASIYSSGLLRIE